MSSENPEIRYEGKTLIAEWDNREIPKSLSLTIFMAGFWVIWTPATLFVTYQFISGDGPWLFYLVWLIFGYAGVVLIPMTWMLRSSVERLEINDRRYCHYYVNFPWWFPKDWDIQDVTRIDFGHYEDESITTLNVRIGLKRDMIAYWSQDEFRKFLFDTIRQHVEKLGLPISVTEL